MRRELQFGLALVLSLLLAMVLELLPLPTPLAIFTPPWLLLVVIYWSLLQPAPFGLTSAWILGLGFDALQSSPLGTHAALFTLVVTPILVLQRLLNNLPPLQQALWIASLVFLYLGGELWLGGQLTAGQVNAEDFLPVLSTLIAWPLIRKLLYRCERCLD